MDLTEHSDEELKQLLVVKYGRDTVPVDLMALKQCPISRELIIREWIADKLLFPRTNSFNVENRFKEVERILNMVVTELRTPKTFSTSYTPTNTHVCPTPSSYTQPAVLTNPALPYTINI